MADNTKLNAQRAQYFTNWPDAVSGYFTSNDSHFFGNAAGLKGAQLEAKNLLAKKQDGAVDTITREEYNAWYAEYAPAQLATAQGVLKDAEAAMADAQSNVNALPKKATIAQQAAANKALNTAKANVANALLEVDTCQAAVDVLNPPKAPASKKVADKA